ncbi:hypothetical protein D3C87_1163010 [compost metagenome]
MDQVIVQRHVLALGAVVDQYIDAAEALLDGLKRRFDAGTAGAVEADDQHFTTLPAQVGFQLLKLCGALRAEGYPGAGEADQSGEMGAEPGGGIGYQYGFAGHGKGLHEVAHETASIGTARRVMAARRTGGRGDAMGAAPSIFSTSSE